MADWFNSSQAMCVAAEVVALKGMRAMVRVRSGVDVISDAPG